MKNWRCVMAAAVIAVAATAARAEVPPVFSAMKYVEAKGKAKDDSKLLIVDATAEWCGPCKKMDKTTWVDEKVVAWVKENAIAIQVDVDKEPELAKFLKIKAMPTIIVVRNGEIFDRAVGYKTSAEFLGWMDQLKTGKPELKAPEDVAAGGKADIQAHLEYARKLVDEEQLDKATAEYAWLWDNMLKHNRGFSGVRVSFMAGDMERLAADHEPAKKRFTELRDATEERLKTFPAGSKSPTGAKLRTDWVALNGIVGDDDRTLAWFDEQRAAGVPAKEIPGVYLFDHVLEARGRWGDRGALLGPPLEEVSELESIVDAPGDAEIKAAAAQFRRGEIGKLYASYLAADRVSDATTVAARAFKIDDSQEMRVALVDYAVTAERPLEKHRGWLDQAAAAGLDVADVRARLEAALAKAPPRTDEAPADPGTPAAPATP